MKTIKLSKTLLVFSLLIISFEFTEIAEAKMTSFENMKTTTGISYVQENINFLGPRRHHRKWRRIWLRRHCHRRHW